MSLQHLRSSGTRVSISPNLQSSTKSERWQVTSLQATSLQEASTCYFQNGQFDQSPIESLSEVQLSELAELLSEFQELRRTGKSIAVEHFAQAYPEYQSAILHCERGMRLYAAHSSQSTVCSGARPFTTTAVGRERLLQHCVLGQYSLREVIGEGAMGTVYRAYDSLLCRDVAIKILSHCHSADRIERFRVEARAAARIQHPNIVPVYSVGCQEGVHFYAMQLIDGLPLSKLIASKAKQESSCSKYNVPFTFQTLAGQVAILADALQVIHDAKVIHRDIKPSNLIVDQANQFWLTDFGLARFAIEEGLTKTGEVVGTLRYMSPEQTDTHQEVSYSSDIYSLGATLYEVATGTSVITGADPAEVIQQIQSGHIMRPRKVNPDIPADLEAIILRALQNAPEDRYPSAIALSLDLQKFACGEPVDTGLGPRGVVRMCRRWLQSNVLAARNYLLAACVVIILMFGNALLLRKEKTRTSVALNTAEKNLVKARSAVNDLGAWASNHLVAIPAAQNVRRELLERTLKYYVQLLDETNGDRDALVASIAVKLEMAELQCEMSAPDLALTTVNETIAECRSAITTCCTAPALEDSQPRDATLQLTLVKIRAHNLKAILLFEQGEAAKAASEVGVAVKLASSSEQLAVHHGLLLLCKVNQLLINSDQYSAPEMDASVKQVLAQAEHGLPNAPRRRSELAGGLMRLSVSLLERQLASAAAHLAELSLSIRRQLVRSGDDCGENLGADLNNLASMLLNAGDELEAIRVLESAIASYREAISQRPGNNLCLREDLAVTLNNYGMALLGIGDAQRAERALCEAENLLMPNVVSGPFSAETKQRMEAVKSNLVVALNRLGRFDEARAKKDESLRLRDSIAANSSPRRVFSARNFKLIRAAIH